MGLILSCSLGPVFFGLVETSITNGYRKAICFATGVFLCDISFIGISYTCSPLLPELDKYFGFMAWIAAAFFILLGLNKVFQPKRDVQKKVGDAHPIGYFQQVLKGFLVNGLNPALFVFWLTLTNVYVNKDPSAPFYFFIGTLMVTFALDIGKSIFAKKIFNLISFLSISKIIRISGYAYIFFGVVIAAKQVYETGS